MTTQQELPHSLQNNSLGKRAMQGAGIAFVLAALFLTFLFTASGLLAGKNFGQGLFEFLPLVTVSVGGAFGGIFYYFVVRVLNPTEWKKIVATVVSALVYFVILWMSLVLGFAATGQWD